MKKYSLPASKYNNRENAENRLSPFTVNFFFSPPLGEREDMWVSFAPQCRLITKADRQSRRAKSEACTSVPMLRALIRQISWSSQKVLGHVAAAY